MQRKNLIALLFKGHPPSRKWAKACTINSTSANSAAARPCDRSQSIFRSPDQPVVAVLPCSSDPSTLPEDRPQLAQVRQAFAQTSLKCDRVAALRLSPVFLRRLQCWARFRPSSFLLGQHRPEQPIKFLVIKLLDCVRQVSGQDMSRRRSCNGRSM